MLKSLKTWDLRVQVITNKIGKYGIIILLKCIFDYFYNNKVWNTYLDLT